jgi:MarR family 2-MHQ and catechol resistance regulon transcriptional repressor
MDYVSFLVRTPRANPDGERRVESAEDRRVRIVALTPRGKDLIASVFRKHSGQMKRVFSELSPEERRTLEVALTKVGKRAAALIEQS